MGSKRDLSSDGKNYNFYGTNLQNLTSKAKVHVTTEKTTNVHNPKEKRQNDCQKSLASEGSRDW